MEGISLIVSWNVEYTDEFEDWWKGLTDDEQEDVAAVVMLLIEHGPQLPIRQELKARSTITCVSCACRAAESRCVDSTPLIHDARQSYS